MPTLRLNPRRLVFLLGIGIAINVLAGALNAWLRVGLGRTNMMGFARMFNMDVEANIPAWFSAMALLLCAGLLFLVAAARRQQADRFATHWLVLALLFVFLSADEAAGIHEALARFVRALTNGRAGSLWVNIPLIAGVGLAYRRFLLHLPRRTLLLFLLAAATFFTGLFGLENMGEAFVMTRPGVYAAIVVVEEMFEMVGVAIFAYALADYLRSHAPDHALRFA